MHLSRTKLFPTKPPESVHAPAQPFRLPLLLAALMLAASVGGFLARPTLKAVDQAPEASLEHLVPRQFGEWREVGAGPVQVVNPQTLALQDRLYSQIVNRVYVNAEGYRVMLSLAYGSDQTGALQAHKPEVCYPAQGFTVHDNEPAILATRFGEIPARRLRTSMGARHEPVTYWFTVGDRAVQGQLQKRLVQMRFGLTGRIPDGMLFRISSIDTDAAHAHRLQREFIDALLQHLSPFARKRLSGLDDAT